MERGAEGVGSGSGAVQGWRAGALALLVGALCGLVVQAAHLVTLRAHPNLDWRVHYNYAREYAAAMAGGDLWPRWAMQAHEGLGEPGLLYYAPLYYWVTGLVSQPLGNVWAAMQLVEIAASALLGLFAWQLAADHLPRRTARWAPLVACLSPMVVMLQLGFNGYPWACASAPLAAYLRALLRPGAQRRWLNLPASVALALTVVTHTVTGLMAVIVTAPLALLGLVSGGRLRLDARRLLAPPLAIAGGLALSAFYLLPGVALQPLIDAAVWRHNFTPFNAFSLSTVTAWLFGMRWFAFQWPISALMIGGTLAGLALLWRAPAARRPGVLPALTLIAGAAVLLSVELSYPLWLIDSPLRNVQFPHRFLTVLVPLMPLVALAALHAGTEGALGRWGRAAVLGVLVAGVALGIALSAKAALRDGAVIDVREATFAPYVGLDEYRTRWTPTGGSSRDRAQAGNDCARGRLGCGAKRRERGAIRWRVAAPADGRYVLPLYYFPALRLTAGERPVAMEPAPGSGLARVALPAGAHDLALRWAPFALERIGSAVSLAALALLVLGTALERSGSFRTGGRRGQRRARAAAPA